MERFWEVCGNLDGVLKLDFIDNNFDCGMKFFYWVLWKWLIWVVFYFKFVKVLFGNFLGFIMIF